MKNREQGRVLRFNAAKGAGRIQADSDGAVLFVLFAAITGEGFRFLEPGQRVEFTREPYAGPREWQAMDVVVIAEPRTIHNHSSGANMDNVRLLKNLYEAFGRGDIPAVLGAMSPDIRWYQAESNPYRPSGEAWVGPEAVLNNLFMSLGGEWDGFTVHTGSFHNAGDTVVVEARYSGTFKSTGRDMDAQVCHVWDVKDGKVTRFQQYVDTAKLRDVMGTR